MKSRVHSLSIFLSVVLATLIGTSGASPSLVPDLKAATAAFRAGNDAFDQGHFEDAIASYNTAISAGASDARLYYNQGNAFFRLNRLGESILSFERARKLSPSDPDINFNLRFARSRIVDKVSEAPTNGFTRILWSLHDGYSLQAGLWFAFTLFALGFTALTLAVFLGTVGRVVSILVALLAFCGLLALSPSLWLRIQNQETSSRAVVLVPVVDLYSGPGEKHEVLFQVHEGTSFQILERRGDWLSVKLPDGKSGFIRIDKIGEV